MKINIPILISNPDLEGVVTKYAICKVLYLLHVKNFEQGRICTFCKYTF